MADLPPKLPTEPRQPTPKRPSSLREAIVARRKAEQEAARNTVEERFRQAAVEANQRQRLEVAAALANARRVDEVTRRSLHAVEVPAPKPALTAEKQHGLPVVIRFAIQVVTGTVAFGLVAGAALLLSLFVDYVETKHVSPYVVTGLRGVELLIFGADMLVMTIFVVVEALDLSRSLLVKAWKTIIRRSEG